MPWCLLFCLRGPSSRADLVLLDTCCACHRHLKLKEDIVTIPNNGFSNSGDSKYQCTGGQCAVLRSIHVPYARIDTVTFSPPSRLDSINVHAFSMSEVRVLKLPASLTTMGIGSLYRCVNLEELWLPIDVTHTDVLNAINNKTGRAENIMYKLRNITLLATPCSDVRASAFAGQLPAGATKIGADAFKDTEIKGKVVANADPSNCTTSTTTTTTTITTTTTTTATTKTQTTTTTTQTSTTTTTTTTTAATTTAITSTTTTTPPSTTAAAAAAITSGTRAPTTAANSSRPDTDAVSGGVMSCECVGGVRSPVCFAAAAPQAGLLCVRRREQTQA